MRLGPSLSYARRPELLAAYVAHGIITSRMLELERTCVCRHAVRCFMDSELVLGLCRLSHTIKQLCRYFSRPPLFSACSSNVLVEGACLSERTSPDVIAPLRHSAKLRAALELLA